MPDEELLQRYAPYLQYDSLESFRSDSAAILPESFFDDGSKWSYTNVLKRKGGSVLASARPKEGQKQLDLAFLGTPRYAGGGDAQATDFLDAAGRRYVEDARRLHGDPRHADRAYGHAVHESSGQTWLQYWFFYYYNDKNYLGIGLHEGDWEMIQIRLGRDGKPNAATFAQHRDGEALNWSDLELRASPDGDVPVVFVGRGSHASFVGSGEHWPMFPLPPDYSDGKGPLVRPALEVIFDEGPGWVLWPGKWGSSDSSPTGPSQKGQWKDPAAFHAELGGSATRGRVRRRARPAPTLPAPPAPELTFTRVDDQVIVKYEFPQRLRAGTARPERVVVSVDTPDDDLPPASHAFTVRTRSGVFAHPMRLEDKRYVVRTVAYSDEGVQSKLVSADLPPSRALQSKVSEEHFDAVVVGSGFGGSVSAFRLAEGGMRVLLLERGKPYPPGSFPRSPWGTSRNFWDPSEGLHGLFNVWEFRGLGGIVASGLGGGSLLYSNLLIRKDRSTFVREDLEHGGWEYWPVTYEDLEPHYERHEAMLEAKPYPMDHAPYDATPKTIALRHAAKELGLEWFLPKLAVTFAPNGGKPMLGEPVVGEEPNLHGRTRQTCRMCGECNFGCNYGSKYTLDFNYLSFAKLRHGVEIRTRCEVRTFAPQPGGGYTIGYVDHTDAVEGERRKAPLSERTVTADRLVLAGGVFGSTYLLLKNRANFPGLSERLGSRFCGNGDLLTFAMRTHETVDGERRGRLIEPGYGPVITSTIRSKDALEGGPGRAFYVQDGGYPETINWMLEVGDQPAGLVRAARLVWRLLKLWLRKGGSSDIGAALARFIGPAPVSSTTLPLFAMGRDIPDGTMRLTEDRLLDVDWNKRRSNPTFEDVRQTGRDIARILDGTFKDNVPWYAGRVVTVHPLGGCPMGRDEREGVVDSYGQVFGYPGFVIADGSVMPGPVGPNPSNTIAALAHRFAERLLEEA